MPAAPQERVCRGWGRLLCPVSTGGVRRSRGKGRLPETRPSGEGHRAFPLAFLLRFPTFRGMEGGSLDLDMALNFAQVDPRKAV